MDKKEFH
ncbi:hypothetical protein GWI33_006285, partial [Rhynchophorus ferrugineus]